ncbi:MAG: Bifunctional transcriptional activator/DNA repair enzyme Ada [Chlamydiae bacterium]|nr:Bifunctional transcriptional activator/DNA repair enzyme Ada [Chlamydiota bacterium]
MKKLHFTKGPLLCVHFFTDSKLILKIKLSSSSQFQANIEGPASSELSDLIQKWLLLYIDSQQPNALPLNFTRLSPFHERVLRALEKIPTGQTLSYKDLALLSQSSKAFRAVGTACKKNPFPLVIPCHRVISSSGDVGNFFYGKALKLQILEFEKTKKAPSNEEAFLKKVKLN